MPAGVQRGKVQRSGGHSPVLQLGGDKHWDGDAPMNTRGLQCPHWEASWLPPRLPLSSPFLDLCPLNPSVRFLSSTSSSPMLWLWRSRLPSALCPPPHRRSAGSGQWPRSQQSLEHGGLSQEFFVIDESLSFDFSLFREVETRDFGAHPWLGSLRNRHAAAATQRRALPHLCEASGSIFSPTIKAKPCTKLETLTLDAS